MTTTWKSLLAIEKQAPYFQELLTQVGLARQTHTVYPPEKEVFNAFKLTEYNQVKVVIIGQDPYHGPNQAHGLCFSVKSGTALPPSLKNIYKELSNDLNISPATHGNLEKWAKQGVLLLNCVLTVVEHRPQSHANLGWQQFTDKVIEVLNQRDQGIVFLLWGAYAQKKCININRSQHFILKAPHPSPLSAHRGYLGCKHFSATNAWLVKNGQRPIDWSLLD